MLAGSTECTPRKSAGAAALTRRGQRPSFRDLSDFAPQSGAPYAFLPFRFTRLPEPPETVLVTSDTGAYAFLGTPEFEAFIGRRLAADSPVFCDLRARGFLLEPGGELHLDLLAAQLRTRKCFLRSAPSLHIFVVTLRCDHSCVYCQVSRQGVHLSRYDMSADTARSAIDRVFESPSPALTIEFQGGEPALAFDLVRRVVEMVEERNDREKRDLTFTMTSTLHLLTEEMLEFCRDHAIRLSTSVDGPAFLHNANRPNPAHDSFARTVESLARARSFLGKDAISGLTTLTRASLDSPKEIVDTYVELGFRSIFLRPLSPYGFALRSARKTGYSMAEFVAFYRRALDYLLQLNAKGVAIEEAYTAVLLTHILTPFPTGYMDLRSPSGAGLGTLVYNYDGKVYASDEGRMAAETGDDRFVLGNADQPYAELIASEAMQWLLAAGMAEALPGCSDCAFLPYCGADPIYHASRQGDPVGHRPTSDFCRKHTGLFQVIFGHLARRDPDVMRIFLAWMTRRDPNEIARSGYMP